VVADFVIFFAFSSALTLAYTSALPRLSIARHRRKLRRLTADELAVEARHCAKAAGYERTFASALLFLRPGAWSRASLARAIDDLYALAAARDQHEGNPAGPGSLVHDFYDFGLVHVRDVLDERPRA
jgi:hypothetical protein